MAFFRVATPFVLASLLAVGAVLGKSAPKPATQPAPLSVKDITGVARQPLVAGDAKAAVLFFLSHDCPISNGYSPEINRICKEFAAEGRVVFHIVHPYAELSTDEAAKHAKEFGYTVPVIVDRQKTLTRAVKARVTPQVVVVSPAGDIFYSGRIDDIWTDYGKRRPEATVRDLRDALTAILAGRPVAKPATEAIGCPIEE